MHRARDENATSVVTIFVNPRQFGDTADLARYPRDVEADLAVCRAEGVDIAWVPTVEEVYPPGFDTLVSVGALAEPWLLPDVDALPDLSVTFADAPNHTNDEGEAEFWPYLRDPDTLIPMAVIAGRTRDPCGTGTPRWIPAPGRDDMA